MPARLNLPKSRTCTPRGRASEVGGQGHRDWGSPQIWLPQTGGACFIMTNSPFELQQDESSLLFTPKEERRVKQLTPTQLALAPPRLRKFYDTRPGGWTGSTEIRYGSILYLKTSKVVCVSAGCGSAKTFASNDDCRLGVKVDTGLLHHCLRVRFGGSVGPRDSR